MKPFSLLLFILFLGMTIGLKAQNFAVISFAGNLNTVCDNLSPVITAAEDFENFTASGILNSDAFNTSNAEYTETFEFKIYPNPCNDFIKLNIPETYDNILITDINGKIILITNTSTVNVSRLKPGIYFFKVNRYKAIFVKYL